MLQGFRLKNQVRMFEIINPFVDENVFYIVKGNKSQKIVNMTIVYSNL